LAPFMWKYTVLVIVKKRKRKKSLCVCYDRGWPRRHPFVVVRGCLATHTDIGGGATPFSSVSFFFVLKHEWDENFVIDTLQKGGNLGNINSSDECASYV
jgi:hypothetical protein